MLLLDSECRVRRANAAAGSLFDLSPGRLRGRRLDRLIPGLELHRGLQRRGGRARQPSMPLVTDAIARGGRRLPVTVDVSAANTSAASGFVVRVQAFAHRHAAGEPAGQARFLQSLLDTLPCPVFYKNMLGIYLGCNRAFEAFMDRTRSEIVGRSVYGLSPKDLADVYYRKDAELLHQGPGGVQIYEASVQPKQGERRNVVFYKANFTDENGRLAGLVGAVFDITAQRRAEEEVRDAHAILEDAIESIDEAFALFDAEDRVVLFNSNFSRLFSDFVEPRDFLGLPFEQMLRAVVESGRIVEAGQGQAAERWYQRRLEEHRNPSGGPALHMLTDGRWIQGRARRTRSGGTVSVLADVTEFKRQEQELQKSIDEVQYLALHDPLTDLPNRTFFRNQLERAMALAERNGGAVAVFFIDLNGFKAVNDSLGHAAGDECLALVAHRLKEGVRAADVLARVGGDEFACFAHMDPSSAVAEATQLAERLLNGLRPAIAVRNRCVQLGASIGIALYPAHGDDIDLVVARADSAMYRAKAQAHPGFRFHGAPDAPAADEPQPPLAG